jgi:hypothetical protein
MAGPTRDPGYTALLWVLQLGLVQLEPKALEEQELEEEDEGLTRADLSRSRL